MKRKQRRPMRAVLIMLYIVVAIGLAYGFHPFVHALGKPVVTMEIGAEGSQVKAELSESGVLTISGKGKTRDYTEETAPFDEYADRITSVKIGEGVTSLGSFLFYNCGSLKGQLVVPSSVIWIGDGAFSGEDREHAPKFRVVESKFTEGRIAFLNPGAEKPAVPEPTTAAGSGTAATPGNAAGGPGAVEGTSIPEEDGTGPTEGTGTPGGDGAGSMEGTGTSGGDGAGSPEGTGTSGGDGAGPTEGAGTPGGDSAGPTEGTGTPGGDGAGSTEGTGTPGGDGAGSAAAAEGEITGTEKKTDAAKGPGVLKETDNAEPEGTKDRVEQAQKQPAAAPEDRDQNGPSGDSEPVFTAASSKIHGIPQMFSLSSGEETASVESPGETAESLPDTEAEAQPPSKATGSEAKETEAEDQEEPEETEATEEYSEDGALSNDLYERAVDPSGLSGEALKQYTIETITSQIIGTDIFFTGQTGAYECAADNITFADAAEQAGYRKADGYVEVDMEGIREVYPITGGMLIAPELPDGIGKPENGGDPLFSDSFSGWTVESDWEMLGYDAPLYTAGSDIPVEDSTKVIVLYANWEKTCTVDPEVEVRAEEARTTYTLIDQNTGTAIPEIEGYQISYQWQICRPMRAETAAGNPNTEEEGKSLINDLEEVRPGSDETGSTGPGVSGKNPAVSENAETREIGPGIVPETESNTAEDIASETESEEAQPSDRSADSFQDLYPANPGDESNWENLEGETAAVCVRSSGKEDAASYFRVMISMERTTWFRTASEPITMYSAPVSGKNVLQKITVIYQPGDGATGTAPVSDPVTDGLNLAPQPNTFTRDDGKVFTGWAVSFTGSSAVKQDGTAVSEGEVITGTTALTLSAEAAAVSPAVTLTAQWSNAVTIWLDGAGGSDGNDGSSEAAAVQTIARAYELLPDMGTVETNRIMVCGNYTISGTVTFPAKPATITSTKISAIKPLIEFSSGSILKAAADTTFENCNINYSSGNYGSPGGIYASGYTLIMGKGLDIDGKLNVAGGGHNYTVGGDTNLIICSGIYDSISGGGWLGNVSGDTHITLYGGECTYIYGGSRDSTNGTTALNRIIINGSTHIQQYGGNYPWICGGSRYGTVKGNGHDYGTKVEILGGQAGIVGGGPHSGPAGQVNKKAWVRVINGEITKSMQGGGFDCNDSTTRFPLMDGAKVEIIDSIVRGNVYGGGNDTYAPKNKPSVKGNIEITVLGSTVEGNIYGGAQLGPVESNVSIHVSDSTVNSVYGAGAGGSGATANVSGLARIVVDGSSRISNLYGGADSSGTVSGGTDLTIVDSQVGVVYGAGKGASTKVTGAAKIYVQSGAHITGNIYGGGESGASGSSEVLIQGGTVDGSIFGGGNNVGTGNAKITVTGSPELKKNIYGGSNNSGTTTSSTITVASPMTGNIYGGGYGSRTTVTTAEVTVGSGASVTGDIFGGGELGNVVNTTVNLNEGTVKRVFGGGNQVGASGTVKVNLNAGSTAQSIYGGSNASGTTNAPSVTVAGAVTEVYGGGLGSGTTTTSPTVTVMTGANVTGNLFGGGEAGAVTGGSTVNIEGGAISAVYGGGNAVGVDGNVTVQTKAGSAVTNLYGGSNSTGTVTGPAITVGGTVTNVYGAGKGQATVTSAPSVTAETGAAITDLYGGGEQGRTQSGTTVLLNSGSRAEHVYGGGSQADVSGVSSITVESGGQAETVYGGSNSSGTVTAPVLTIRGTVTNVYGAGKGNQTVTKTPSVTADNGAAVTYLYGGGEEGQTQDGTTITLKGGSRAENVFGGGNAAGVTGAVSVTAENGSRIRNVYGGSNSTGVVETVMVTVDGTAGGTGVSGTGASGTGAGGIADGPGAIYGGGLGAQTSTGTPTVVIDSNAVVTGEVFGGGAQGPITGNTTVILKPSSSVTGNVYAGGDAAVVNGSTRLEANDGSVITGSLFGGGKGTTAEIKTNTRVLAFAHITGNVFGGGAEGAVGGSTHVDIAKGLVDGDGVNTGNVFGGSDKAKVGGNTQVHIGWEAASGTGTSVAGASLVIKGTVFGGGNTTDNGSTFDASDPFVLGNSEVSVEATGYDTANFNIEKNIFGDGNMCTVKGSRTVSIKDYEALGGQSNTSIQRADILTVEDSRIELTGAIDSANLVPTIAYSLNRIDELVIKNGSTLKLQAPVNLVKHLKSLDSAGTPVTTTATDTAAAPLSPENRIDIQQGVQMELRTSEDVTTTEYGAVTGYLILDAYDKDGGAIESGIYVLGNYAADESSGGFLYGSGAGQYKKIVPTTDGRTWRNWAIGTDMKRSAILAMSNKPAGEKIIQMESPWPADGSIYQLVKNSVEITTTLSDGSKFVLKDPEGISASDPVNTTLGIAILTGNQGWVNQINAGYITGNSSTGATGGGFGGLSAQSMQTLNNRSIKPMIQIELTNRVGVTNGDPVGEYPLTVQFQMENVKKLSDGSLSKLGTLTVVLQIRREAAQTYDDILLSTGKEYTRGTQTYAFDTAGGTGGGAGATITKQSAITLQYARKRDDEPEGARDHRLSFSTNTTPASEGTRELLPEGVKILLVDQTDTYPVYAHYTVPAGGISEVLLSEFIKNGTANQRYSRTFSQNEKENYLVILDFGDAPGYSQDRLCATFEPIYGGSTTVKPARIVFNIASDPKSYTPVSPDATGENGGGKAYDREGKIPFTLTIWSSMASGIDTTGIERRMSARLKLKNRDAGVDVPVPSDWLITSEGETYQSNGGTVTIPLASSMMDTTASLEIGMKPNSLPAGRYQWEIHLTSSALAGYPGSLTDTPLYLNFDLVDKQYSVQAAYRDPSASRLYPAKTAKPRFLQQLRVEMKADNGAVTDNVKQRVSLWEKDSSTGQYANIDFGVMYDGMTGLSQSYDWSPAKDLDFTFKQSLPEGTYRLKFELVQTESGVERVLTYDTENFIVTPQ